MNSRKRFYGRISHPPIVLSALFALNLVFLGAILFMTWKVNKIAQEKLISDIQSLELIEQVSKAPSVTDLVRDIISYSDFEEEEQHQAETKALSSLILRIHDESRDPFIRKLADEWHTINDKLVGFELRAIDMAKSGKSSEALDYLRTEEYRNLIYDYDDYLISCQNQAKRNLEDSKSILSKQSILIYSTVVAILVTLIVAWIMSYILITRHMEEKKKMMEQLLEVSQQDALTGLYNRHGFMIVAGQVWKEASRAAQEVAIMFIDLDGLKTINDTQGHKIGDKAICAAADVISKTFRDSDITGRIGGDEFVVVAKGLTSEEYTRCIERLKKNIEMWNHENPDTFELAMSVGFSMVSPAEITLSKAMIEADALMYAQKKQRKIERETREKTGLGDLDVSLADF